MLEIRLDFKSGSTFPYVYDNGTVESCKAYDTVEKKWRHLKYQTGAIIRLFDRLLKN